MTKTWRVAGIGFGSMHETGTEPAGPLTPEARRRGQRILGAAVASAARGCAVAVPE